MAKNKIEYIVNTKCQPEDEEEFNKWYNEIHIPMVLKFKKLKEVSRFRTIGHSLCSYIAIYGFANLQDLQDFEKSPELELARKEMQETWGTKIEIVSRDSFELIKEWENKK
jgi:antibiotic biosynthesis monooxygenase (ABM) superfamily enzyme